MTETLEVKDETIEQLTKDKKLEKDFNSKILCGKFNHFSIDRHAERNGFSNRYELEFKVIYFHDGFKYKNKNSNEPNTYNVKLLGIKQIPWLYQTIYLIHRIFELKDKDDHVCLYKQGKINKTENSYNFTAQVEFQPDGTYGKTYDMALILLENGCAEYDPNSIKKDFQTKGLNEQYKNAEDYAKKQGFGIWAKDNN